MKKKKNTTIVFSTSQAKRLRPSKAYLARLDALTDAQITKAALSDKDNAPLTKAEFKRATAAGVPVREMRTQLHMTQNQFAKQFHIPLSTLKDWEQARYLPDQAARNYLQIIAYNPAFVIEALERPSL